MGTQLNLIYSELSFTNNEGTQLIGRKLVSKIYDRVLPLGGRSREILKIIRLLLN